MSTSLSSLADSLSEKLHSDKCKDCKSELDYISVKDNQLIFQCLECKKSYNKDCNKELTRKSRICYMTKAMFIFINKLSFHTGNIVKLQ